MSLHIRNHSNVYGLSSQIKSHSITEFFFVLKKRPNYTLSTKDSFQL